MKKLLVGLMSLLLLLVLAGCGQQQTGTTSPSQSPEATSANVNVSTVQAAAALQEEEYRIVSTTVAITQILDKLELDLVGIPTSSKELPARYDQVTQIGNPMSPDMEIIASLKPSDVYSVTTLEYDLKPVFEQAGIAASFLNLTSVGAMNDAIVMLGEKYNRQQQASDLIETFENKVKEIKQMTAQYDKPSVLILMGIPGSYLVATENSYIGDLVRLAGGVNVVEGENVEYLSSNTEYLFQSNPDVILRAAHGMPEEVIKMFDRDFKTNDIWKHFNAVKNDRVYDLEEVLFGTTGNILAIEAIDVLLPMLYPEAAQN